MHVKFLTGCYSPSHPISELIEIQIVLVDGPYRGAGYVSSAHVDNMCITDMLWKDNPQLVRAYGKTSPIKK